MLEYDFVPHDLQYEQVGHDAAAGSGAGQAERAEEVHRAGEIFEQELDGEDVEHHAEGAADAVVGIARGTRHVADGHFDHTRAVKAGQGGNEAVEFAVEVDVLEDFGAVGFEGGAEIAEVHAAGLGHQPVGDARRNLAHDGVIHAMFAPAAGDVVALVDFFEQRGNVLGAVLQVAIHGDDDVALGFVEAGRERGGLAEVAAQADHLEVAVGLHQVGEEFEAAIVGGVVDEEDLVGPLQLFENRGEAVVQREYGGLLVVDRNHDRQHWHTNF